MTFETMDWEAEAKRVAAAFRTVGEVKFLLNKGRMNFGSSEARIRCERGYLNGYYGRSMFVFAFGAERAALFAGAKVIFSYDRSVDFAISSPLYSSPLARGLFHLDLLTPEVEAELQVTITAHEKVEWTLDYAKRLQAVE